MCESRCGRLWSPVTNTVINPMVSLDLGAGGGGGGGGADLGVCLVRPLETVTVAGCQRPLRWI